MTVITISLIWVVCGMLTYGLYIGSTNERWPYIRAGGDSEKPAAWAIAAGGFVGLIALLPLLVKFTADGTIGFSFREWTIEEAKEVLRVRRLTHRTGA